MNILFLRGFNNYFNRVIKKYSTLTDYQSESTASVNFESINFNPNDGVATELVLGNESQKENNLPLDWENIGTPDYCVCYEMVNSSPVIRSRWFVLESERLRSGQYRLALKRDVVADHFSQIKNAPCFIEKGMINDIDNKFLYNKENMSYNQIKMDEIPLKDETESAWIVGYLNNKDSADNIYEASPTLSSSGTASGTYIHQTGENIVGIVEAYVTAGAGLAHHTEYITATINSSGNIQWSVNWPAFAGLQVFVYISYQRSIDIELDANDDTEFDNAIDSSLLPWTFNPNDTSINIFLYFKSVMGFVYKIDNTWAKYYNCQSTLTWNGASYTAANLDAVESPWASGQASSSIVNNFIIYTENDPVNYLSSYRNAVKQSFWLSTYKANLIFAQMNMTFSNTNENLTNYNNAIVEHNGHYYKLTINTGTEKQRLLSLTNGTTVYSQYVNTFPTVAAVATSNSSNNVIWKTHSVSANENVTVRWKTYSISVEELNRATLKVEFPPSSTRAHLDDGVYDMFCIPYNPVKFYNETKTSNSKFSLMTALHLSRYFGSQLYDLQLLPYCPARFFISDTNTIDEQAGTLNTDYCYIKKSLDNEVVSFILFCTRSSWSFPLDYTINIPVVDSNTIINRKISNECDLYRLTSPNYSGQFEFSVAKNGGSVTGFNVDLTYRPYNPYIHINPNFDGLYGQDWDDSRGLICGGDFSLPIISDAWTEYQLQNKNYQNIFDRQIQNMDVTNQIQQEQLSWQKAVSAITGGLGGTAGGAMAGAKIGGPWGAAIGGALGAATGLTTSIIGGNLDQNWLTRQQQENKSYAIDMYNYNLGNIKAMPYSLTKSGTLTNNNKIFPFIEYYSCTDMEKEALKNILKYDGMTIMAISTINQYLPQTTNVMIKGRLIRLENINDDFHIADAIYDELQKGVYLTPGMEE